MGDRNRLRRRWRQRAATIVAPVSHGGQQLDPGWRLRIGLEGPFPWQILGFVIFRRAVPIGQAGCCRRCSATRRTPRLSGSQSTRSPTWTAITLSGRRKGSPRPPTRDNDHLSRSRRPLTSPITRTLPMSASTQRSHAGQPTAASTTRARFEVRLLTKAATSRTSRVRFGRS